MVESINSYNAIVNQAYAANPQKGQVITAIKSASERTGVDFSYLLNEAMAESSLNPTAKAKTSSATGLYQFVDQTWLRTMKETGAKHGLGQYADQIQIGRDGVARATTHEARREILALRNDPVVSSNMAAELAKSNERVLARKVGGDIGATELYMAHFLGAGGASKFLNAIKENPDATAANLFPSAAKANKNVFYDTSTGKPRSVSQIYTKFAAKFDAPAAPSETRTAYASATVPQQPSDANNLDQSLWQPGVGFDYNDMMNAASMQSRPEAHQQAPFTAMLLAQMDMDMLALDAQDFVGKVGAYERTQQKSILSQLSDASVG